MTTSENQYNLNSLQSNTTILAYIGDAVYEVFIRRHVIQYGGVNVNKLNRKAIQFVSADGQAAIINEMISRSTLSDEEVALVKRARNHTNTNRPRGSTHMQYKWATGFEALVGYLYLSGQEDRLKEVIDAAISIGEEQQNVEKK